jgi:hypothetical protein
MKQTVFRDLRPEEIEVRVGNIVKDKSGNPKGFQLLLYKTSRTDMAILDETFGTFGWRNHFYQVKNTMVCSIEIYDEETKQWINKDNGGDDDTAMEQVKSELSDSIKRAGSTLGIGRKLYSASKIYMVVDITEENTTKSYYQVKDIAYDEKSITKLVIINKKTKEVVISYGSSEKVAQTAEKAPQKRDIIKEVSKDIGDSFVVNKDAEVMCCEETKKKIQEITGKLSADRYANFKNYLKGTFNVESIAELTESQGQQLLKALRGGK